MRAEATRMRISCLVRVEGQHLFVDAWLAFHARVDASFEELEPRVQRPLVVVLVVVGPHDCATASEGNMPRSDWQHSATFAYRAKSAVLTHGSVALLTAGDDPLFRWS
jgi:hypothetical protein